MEVERQRMKTKKRPPQKKTNRKSHAEPKQRKHDRVKKLVNIGELRKAMSTLTSNVVAPMDDNVLQQLQKKHPYAE